MQIRISTADDAYTNARREDLIQILDGLGAESRRLEREIAELQQTKTNLECGADSRRVAQEETEQRLAELSILAGTAPAKGPGSGCGSPTRTGGERRRAAGRGAGDAGRRRRGDRVQRQVRVVASTWFGSRRQRADRRRSGDHRPVTMEVIGDPHSLEEAARFRGGIVSEITGPRVGGQVTIERLDEIDISSLHTPERRISTLGQHLLRPPRGDRRSATRPCAPVDSQEPL